MPILVLLLLGLAITVLPKAIMWVAIAFVLAIIGSFSNRLGVVCAIIAIFSSFIVIGYDSNSGSEKFIAIAAFILMWISLIAYINASKSSSQDSTTEKVGVFDAINNSLISLFHQENSNGEKPNYKAYIFGIMVALVVAFMCFLATII